MEKHTEKKHLRDTWYFKRCCSSVSHSNLKSVHQAPNARVWAYTHKYCKLSSGIPTVARDDTEYWLPGKVLAAQPVLGGDSCVWDLQPPALKLPAWSSPRPRGDVRSRMPRLGAGRSRWDGGRADVDWTDAASAQPWEGGGNCNIWIEEIRSEGFKWKLFSPVQMSLGTKFSC